MSGPRQSQHNLSRVSSYNSVSTTATDGTDDGRNAALLGATKAFGRPPPKPREGSTTRAVANGAVKSAAALGKGKVQAYGARSPERAGTSGNGKGITGLTRQEPPNLNTTRKPNLAVPTQHAPARSKSPSQQAAQLANARSPEPSSSSSPARPRAKTTQRPSIVPKPRRLSEHFSQPNSPTDDSPIPPTTSLVELFERKTSTPASPQQGKRPHPIAIRPSKELPLRSPKPVRASDSGGITSVFQMELGESKKDAPKASRDISAKDHAIAAQYDGQSESSEDYVSASEDTAAASSPITIRKLRDSRAPSIDSQAAFSSMGSPEPRRLRPLPSPIRHTNAPSQPIQIQQASPRAITSPSDVSVSSQSGSASIAAQYHRLHPRRVTPLHTGDDLANAIVASSLASSRAGSPHKARLEPPPPPTRRGKHSFSRTPSPAKHGMRHTLRKQESETEEDSDDELHPYGKHKKKRLVRKHPNKHHEGDRKRWRDAVTERERKRYEGVWAANKGLHITFTIDDELSLQQQPESDEAKAKRTAEFDRVSNIVTRDIWSRSRLGESTLEMVWDLVDNDCVGRLSKEEFVVGMWLIDQRLKGRKLPVKVSDSVWTSVRGIGGLKVRGSKMH